MHVTHSIIGIEKIWRWALAEYGVSSRQLLSQTGITPSRLKDPFAQVQPREELQFYRNLVEAISDPALGLRAGFQLTASCYGIWGLAIQSSRTLLDGIRMGLEYIDFTYTFNDIRFVSNEGIGCMQVEAGACLQDLSRFMVQRDLAAIARLIHDGLQPEQAIVGISLLDEQLPQRDALQTMLSCPLNVGAERDSLSVDEAYLHWPLNQANALTWSLCRTQLDQRASVIRLQNSLSERVLEFLRTRQPLVCKMEEVAGEFAMGVRSFRHRLNEEGTGFKALVDQVRRERVKDFLKREDLTLEQVAEQLGYSDSVSLSHACKRWFNMAPRALEKRFGNSSSS